MIVRALSCLLLVGASVKVQPTITAAPVSTDSMAIDCQETEVEKMLMQVVIKFFAAVAMLFIPCIAALVVTSDIHMCLTRRKPQQHHSLLLDSNEIAIEMDRFPSRETKRRKKFLGNHSSTGYAPLFQSQSGNSIPTHYASASLSFD